MTDPIAREILVVLYEMAALAAGRQDLDADTRRYAETVARLADARLRGEGRTRGAQAPLRLSDPPGLPGDRLVPASEVGA